MPSTHIVRRVRVDQTARVMQMQGMFDVPPGDESVSEWDASLELPEEWSVGLIVGPSGSGKSTVAREFFSANICSGFDWPENKSILDGFPESLGIKDVVALLSSVGFNSPPSWLRPYHVLSNGEQFRVTMARALAESRELCVVDEFTSVVDRTVAQVGSAAIAKAVRRRGQKFIAVTCHYDVAEWLAPDWIYEPHLNRMTLARGCLQRPSITLEIARVGNEAWPMFKKHHYLTGSLSRGAVCFCAFLNGEPVAFDSWLPRFGRTKSGRYGRRSHRTVVLPDYQGIGIGHAVVSTLASAWRGLGYDAFRTTGHPGEISKLMRSKDWICIKPPMLRPSHGQKSGFKRAFDRLVASFEFVGAPMDTDEAARLLGVQNGRNGFPE